jgi:hypothetical protein
MAMFGWSTPNQAAVYTRKANQRKLAREGVALLAKGMQERTHMIAPPQNLGVPHRS